MQRALDNATKYLEMRHLSIPGISAGVQDVMPWETVIFGGSIPEGLANADADIDLMLVGGARPHDGQVVLESESEVSFRMAFAPLKVQVETVRLAHMELLATRMRETAAALHNPDGAPRLCSFPLADLRIMHRLRTGICLGNPDVAEHWRKLLHCELLPKYMLVLYTIQHFSLREDAIGEAREGRYESCLWLVRDSLSRAAGALLASKGESHSYDKWRVRQLQLNVNQVDEKLASALIEHLTAPKVDDPDRYLRDAVNLADDVIEAAVMNCPETIPILMKLRNEQIPLTTHVAD
jgi:hypothetical protein